MALLRFNLLLAIPLRGSVPIDAKPSEVLSNLPIELRPRMLAIREGIRLLKRYSVKINTEQPNEEATIVAGWHVYRHDEGNLNCVE